MIKISDLVDIYKREVSSDSLALRNIGKRISGKKDIQIEYSNYNDLAFTDGRNICLPYFCRNEIKAAQGFVAHESGHIGYGSFEIGFLALIRKLTDKYEVPAFFVKHLVNILEDVRVNELNKKEFPGFYKNLRDYTLKVLPKIEAKIKHFENIFLYLNLYMENYSEYQKKPHFPRFPLSDKDWETIQVVKKFLLKALTPNASIISADQLCKVLIKYFKFEKKKPNTTSSKGISSSRKYFERRVYLGEEMRSERKNVIILPNHFEKFSNKEIEEKETNLSRSSNKMIEKIDKIDISTEDLKQLTDEIEGINNENEGIAKEEIGKKIDGKLKDVSKNSTRIRNPIKDIRESLEKVYINENDLKDIKKEEKKIGEILKKHINTKRNVEEKIIKKKKKEASELKEIINELDDLNEETNEEIKAVKRKSLSKKIKSYQQKRDLKRNSASNPMEKEENKLLDDLIETFEKEDKNSNKISSKQKDIIKTLKKNYNIKKNEINERKKNLNNDLNELQNILETLENDNNSENIINKSKSLLSKIESYEKKLKTRGENEDFDYQFWTDLNESKEEDNKNNPLVIDLTKEVNQANNQLKKRLIEIGKGVLCLTKPSSKEPRKIIETRIENDAMDPIKLSYSEIRGDQRALIRKMNMIFKDLKKSSDFDNYQKRGRLNKNFIKTVTSNYRFKKCFTRRIHQKILKILVLVDISGSMRGRKLECAKISMIILTEALRDLAEIRIVLFTGNYDAKNILVKDFGEPLVAKKVDMVGCHKHIKSNLDGLSLKHEAEKMQGDELIIVISDGQPAGYRGYGLKDAMDQIHKVRKRFKVFAFSIDAKGEYLDTLYGKNNWILTKSTKKTDLIDKIMKFSRLVVKEFY